MSQSSDQPRSRAERLREEISRTQESFCETTLKRFRVHLCKFAADQNISLAPGEVHKHSRDFYHKIKSCQSEHYVSKLAGIRREIGAALRNGGELAPWSKAARDIAVEFSKRMAETFHEFSRASIPAAVQADGFLLDPLIQAFHLELSQRTLRQTAKIIELFTLSNKASKETDKAPDEAGPHSDSEPAADDASGVEAASEHGAGQDQEPCCLKNDAANGSSASPMKIEDLFGRGLLYPLDLYFQVCDPDSDAHDPRRPVFPRRFCAPVLLVSRSYLIGREKYRGANEQFVRYLSQVCDKGDGDFTREDCVLLFEEPRIKLFLMGYLLNNLKVFTNEIKQEKFMDNVNAALVRSGFDDAQLFEGRHFSVLTNAWARFLYENFDELKAKKTGKAVLKHYVPALVTKLQQREASRRARV